MNPQQALMAQALMGSPSSFQQQNGSAQGSVPQSGQAAAANPGLLGAIPQTAQPYAAQPAQTAAPAMTQQTNPTAAPIATGTNTMTPAQQLALAQQQALLQSGASAGAMPAAAQQ